MRQMRPYKPAPKNSSANRIRERYLHQLGLQRGAGRGTVPLAPPQSNQQVVVISGLPPLPEDRAATEHVMESHDFSISRNSHHTGGTPGSTDANSSGKADDASDAGSADVMMVPDVPSSAATATTAPAAVSAGDSSYCSKSTLSASPEAGGILTSMALAYPTTLRKVPPGMPSQPPPPPAGAPHFSRPQPVPWFGATSLSKPASVLLDSAEHRTDGCSVSSAGTSTTAESSLTAAMVSKDWGSMPPAAASSGTSGSSLQGESPTSAPGVYFMAGARAPGGCAASSLAHALHQFNIESDCDLSAASGSVVDDRSAMDADDDASLDDASLASRQSEGSGGGPRPERGGASRKKKIGRTQRLMDRAAAHEKILQRRSDRSQRMRASLVHSQRMGHQGNGQVSVSGLTAAMASEAAQEGSSESPGSASSGGASMALLHVDHSMAEGPSSVARSPAGGDLGRTPTASNCSDLRAHLAMGGSPGRYLPPLPRGVHVAAIRQGMACSPEALRYLPQGIAHGVASPLGTSPLGYQPRLASRVPPPPPGLAQGLPPSPASRTPPSQGMGSQGGDATSLQHLDHGRAPDHDMMEVALTLSKLGGGANTPLSRCRQR